MLVFLYIAGLHVWVDVYGREDEAKDGLFKECKAEADSVVSNTGQRKGC